MSVESLIKSVDRELALRRNVYPRRIAAGKMKPELARKEIQSMEEIREILVALKPLSDLLQPPGNWIEAPQCMRPRVVEICERIEREHRKGGEEG